MSSSASLSLSAASATRSEPVRHPSPVSIASPPNALTAPATCSLSVATTTRRTSLAEAIDSTVCWISGLPVSARIILPGRRVEEYLAGMTAIVLMAPRWCKLSFAFGYPRRPHALPRYSPLRVSTLTTVPFSTNGGTLILAPPSQTASLS